MGLPRQGLFAEDLAATLLKDLVLLRDSQEASLAATSAVDLARDTNSELRLVTVAEKYPSYEVYRPLSSHSHHLARKIFWMSRSRR